MFISQLFENQLHENAEELNIGDPVIIVGKVQFQGSTGEIAEFGKDKRFVIVNLYNHGRHSFHSSDVEYNDYADSDDEDMRMYDTDPQYRDWTGRQEMEEEGAADFPPPENAQKTQIAGTLPTYKKGKAHLDTHQPTGKTLDFGAGLGGGAAEMGADSYEPFPRAGFTPTYTKSSEIPSDSYHRVTNFNVLNVVPQNIRNTIVSEIGRVLAPGGIAIITTRGKDVMTSKGQEGPEPMSRITSIGTYQKGFTTKELMGYVQQVLGQGFEVQPIKLGPAGVLVRKSASEQRGVAEGTDLPPKVIEMIKKISQSNATPEHKKAAIDAIVAKHSKQGVAEGGEWDEYTGGAPFPDTDDLDTYSGEHDPDDLDESSGTEYRGFDIRASREYGTGEVVYWIYYRGRCTEHGSRTLNGAKKDIDYMIAAGFFNDPDEEARKKQHGLAEGSEQTINIGDDVVITGNSAYAGVTGRVIGFREGKIVVDMLEQGKVRFAPERVKLYTPDEQGVTEAADTHTYYIVNSDTNKNMDGPFDSREEAEKVYDRMIARVGNGNMKKNFKIQKKQGVAEGAKTPAQKNDFKRVMAGAMSRDDYNKKYSLGKYAAKSGKSRLDPTGVYHNLIKTVDEDESPEQFTKRRKGKSPKELGSSDAWYHRGQIPDHYGFQKGTPEFNEYMAAYNEWDEGPRGGKQWDR